MISIRHLSKTHHNRGNNQVKALTDINIDFDETGITFIAGESGNGKSSLLSLIGCIDSYEDGEILIDGKDLKLMTKLEQESYRNSYIDFIIQENTLIPSLTVAENVRLEKSIHGEYTSDEDVDAALDIVGLKGYGDRMPAEISGGEKKRVAMARTMLMDVKVILVDEPTASLDKKNSTIVWDVLKKYSENHLVIAVSHNEQEVNKYADRVITLEKGEVVEDRRVTPKPTKRRKAKQETEQPQKFQKSKLGAKQTVKLAYSYLSSRKVSFSFVTILSCLALLFFSVFFILNSYDFNKVLAYSIKESETPYVAFVNGTTENSSPITEIQSSKIIEKLRKDGLPILSSFKDMAEVNFAVKFGNGFYTSKAQTFTVRGLLQVEDEVGDYNSIGQKVLSGAYPTNDNEVVISDYMAELIRRYGVYAKVGGVETLLNSSDLQGTESDKYADIIGKEIVTDNGNIVVSGVYETDYKRFVFDEDLGFRGYDREEYTFKLHYIYSTIHTTSGFISAYADSHKTAEKIVARIEKDSSNSVDTTNFTAVNLDGSAETFYLKTGKTLSEVTSTDVIISVSLYNSLVNGLAGYNQIDETSLTGEVDFGINQEAGANLSLNISIGNGEMKTYTIVGLYKQNASDTDTKIYFTKTRYIADVLSQTTFSASTKILYTQVGNSTIEKVINSLDDTSLEFVSINSETIKDYGNKIRIMSSAFLIASVFIAIYTLMLMYYFLSQMIVDKKSDIGILKTLGCGTKDIVKIFALCSLVIAFLVFIATVILTFVAAALANVIVVSQIPVTVSAFSTSGIMYLWIALICLFVVFVGTSIPIARYSKLPPKELLKIF